MYVSICNNLKGRMRYLKSKVKTMNFIQLKNLKTLVAPSLEVLRHGKDGTLALTKEFLCIFILSPSNKCQGKNLILRRR